LVSALLEEVKHLPLLHYSGAAVLLLGSSQ
jgi:hypothetical protein